MQGKLLLICNSTVPNTINNNGIIINGSEYLKNVRYKYINKKKTKCNSLNCI